MLAPLPLQYHPHTESLLHGTWPQRSGTRSALHPPAMAFPPQAAQQWPAHERLGAPAGSPVGARCCQQSPAAAKSSTAPCWAVWTLEHIVGCLGPRPSQQNQKVKSHHIQTAQEKTHSCLEYNGEKEEKKQAAIKQLSVPTDPILWYHFCPIG